MGYIHYKLYQYKIYINYDNKYIKLQNIQITLYNTTPTPYYISKPIS